MQDLSSQLAQIAKRLGANFTLKSRVVTYQEVFADNGLLPGLTKRADQLASLCLGYGLGASYEDAEKTIMGTKVKFDNFTSQTVRLFCILDVIQELIKSSPSRSEIPLDELLYD